MEKNWLIRTKNQHILGPISKNKVNELFNNGSIKGDDEVCSGNGYWFYIREKDLVEKYLIGEIPQGFNPVCEGITVLDTSSNTLSLDDDNLLPSEDDLEYPDLDSISDDEPVEFVAPEIKTITEQVIDLSSPVTMSKEDINLPDEEDLEYPDLSIVNVDEEDSIDIELLEDESAEDEVETVVKNKNYRKKTNVKNLSSKSILNGNLVYFGAVLFLILAISGFYFRNRIINFINSSVSVVLPTAYAQSDDNLLQKKKLKKIQSYN